MDASIIFGITAVALMSLICVALCYIGHIVEKMTAHICIDPYDRTVRY